MASRFSDRTAALALVLAAAVAAPGAQGPPAERRRPDSPAPERSRAEPAAAESPAVRAAARIRALQRESDALALQEKTLLVELRALEVERALKTEQLASAERDLKETQRRLAEANLRAAALRGAADTQRPGVEARLVHLYKMGRAGYWKLLLDVDDLQAVGRAYRTAAAMHQLDRERVLEHQRTLDALAAERQRLEAEAATMARLQRQAATARAGIDRAVAARTRLVDSIDARRDLNAQLTGELEAAQQNLQGAVAGLDTGRAGVVTLPLRPFKGVLPWPAAGIVTGRFGRHIAGTAGASGAGVSRTGIEMSLAEGQPVRSVHDGVVAYADQFTGYGNLVILEHGDGAYSLYGFLAEMAVARGDRLDALGQVGASGRNPSGNPALYFELRVDGGAVDPLQWLKR
jgi:septal ring factor EnvC (AmiA/AmiB activator)